MGDITVIGASGAGAESGYYLNVRAEMASFLPKTFTKSLEIGCGVGRFSEHFLATADERWGVEPNREAAAIAAPKLTRLLCGTYSDVSDKIPDGYFDIVVCNDVIEHMPDHDRFLCDIATKMKPGGYLVGSLPNIRHFTALIKLLVLKDWPYSDDGILDRTHLRFFTEKSLRRSLTSKGFIVERLDGIKSIIRQGVHGLSPAKNLVVRPAATLLIVLTLGYWSDIQYPQFGFHARLKNGYGLVNIKVGLTGITHAGSRA